MESTEMISPIPCATSHAMSDFPTPVGPKIKTSLFSFTALLLFLWFYRQGSYDIWEEIKTASARKKDIFKVNTEN
jgi:hypothetical protein